MTDIADLKKELATVAKALKPNLLDMAKAWASGKTQEESYIASGGKAKAPRAAASQLIATNPNISLYVELAKKIAVMESQAQLIGTLDQKRRLLWDIANRCAQEIEPVYEGRGEEAELVGYSFDSRGAVAAIAELNKMDGDLAAIKTDNKNTNRFEGMSEQELDDKLAELQRKAGAGSAS